MKIKVREIVFDCDEEIVKIISYQSEKLTKHLKPTLKTLQAAVTEREEKSIELARLYGVPFFIVGEKHEEVTEVNWE